MTTWACSRAYHHHDNYHDDRLPFTVSNRCLRRVIFVTARGREEGGIYWVRVNVERGSRRRAIRRTSKRGVIGGGGAFGGSSEEKLRDVTRKARQANFLSDILPTLFSREFSKHVS